MTDDLNDDDDKRPTSDLKTLFGHSDYYKLKTTRWFRTTMKDLLVLFVFIFGLAFGCALIGLFQYWNCTMRFPEISAMQCFRAEFPKGKK